MEDRQFFVGTVLGDQGIHPGDHVGDILLIDYRQVIQLVQLQHVHFFVHDSFVESNGYTEGFIGVVRLCQVEHTFAMVGVERYEYRHFFGYFPAVLRMVGIPEQPYIVW